MAGVQAFTYGQSLAKLSTKEISLVADDIRFALVLAAYTPDLDAHAYWSSVVANEATGTAWAAGGQALAGKTLTQTGATNLWTFTATNLSVAGVTVAAWRYGVLYDRTPATDATRPLLALLDWGSTQAIAAATFSVTWSASGILAWTYA